MLCPSASTTAGSNSVPAPSVTRSNAAQRLQSLAAATGRQRLVRLGHREDPSAQGNLLAGQCIGLAGAIPSFVVAAHVSQDLRRKLRPPQDLFAGFGVAGSLETLAGGQGHVTDVVEEGCSPQVLEAGHRQGRAPADGVRDYRHAARMAARHRAAVVDGVGHGDDHLRPCFGQRRRTG